MPYYSQTEREFGVNPAAWRVLVEAIFPAATTVEAVWLALAYCRKRNLDPFKRVVHIVPMYSSTLKMMVETVWPGIGELRTTAFRTREYAGMDAVEVGPSLVETFKGKSSYKDRYGREKIEERDAEVTFHEWMRITVYRLINGQRYSFVGPKVYWKEIYAKWKNTDVPNDRWRQSPNGQHEKCTQAAALRNSFPEELGNEYAAEEMEGRTILNGAEPLAFSEPPDPNAPPALMHMEHDPGAPGENALDGPAKQEPAERNSSVDTIIEEFAKFAKTAKNIEELIIQSEVKVDPYYDLWPKEQQIEFDRLFRLSAAALPGDD